MPVTMKQRKKMIKGLNPQQKDAVLDTLDDPSLVIAGAGSGKTKVLTTRVAYLISEGVDPYNIMAVTFTNKASMEMRQRIKGVVGEEDAKELTIGSFHSLCVRWLHQYYREAGLRKNWSIYDEDDSKKILKKVLRDLGEPSTSDVIKYHVGVISDFKNKMLTPGAVYKRASNDNERRMYSIYKAYQDELSRVNACDFDDLLMKMVLVLGRSKEVRRAFQRRYHYVMVDEYQDTNECQYRLIRRIVGKRNNLFIVGDDFQSIYGWRGADIDKILNFQRDYPGALIFKLEENYRSTKRIVEAGNKIMENAPNQMQKTCFTANMQGDKLRVHNADTDIEEASFVAQEIMNLVTFEGYKYSDFAILYRANSLSRLLEEKLMFNMIPYNMVSGFSFYERREVKDVLAWLQLAVNPDNDIACERVLGLTPNLGKTTIDAMNAAQRKSRKSLYEIVENHKPKMVKTQFAIAGLTQTVVKLNSLYQVGQSITDTPITDMLELILQSTGYVDTLKASKKDEDRNRVENVMELIKMAGGYEEEQPNADVQDFLDQIALSAQSDKISAQTEDKVQMMTLHTAKGLEFPIVFIVGFEEGLLPHAASTTDTEIAEERRLAYVGITRAEKLLYLTMCKRRMDWKRNYNYKKPSRFLDFLPANLYEEV